MPSVPTRAGLVSYRIEGTGQPIVLLHANLHDHHDYDSVIERFATSNQVVAVDWPWHGESEGISIRDNLSAVGFADVLEDIVEQLHLPPAVLIGNSVGGFAAARLAITHPDRVRGLVLVNAGGFVDWTFFSRVGTWLFGIAPISRLVMPYLVRKYMSPQTQEDEEITRRVAATAGTREGSSVAATLWRSFLDPAHDLRDRAANIKAPVLLVWGTRDPIIPTSAGQATHRYIPGSTLELFDTGHVVFSSKPEQFVQLVQEFMDSIPTNSK